MIRVFEDAIPCELCERIIEHASSYEEVIPDSSQRNYTGVKSLDKNKMSLFDSQKKQFYSALIENDNPLVDEVLASLSPRLVKFLSEIDLPAKVTDLILTTPPEFEEWKVKRYPPGGFFGLHVDGYGYTDDNSIPMDAKGTVPPGEWQVLESKFDRWVYHNRFIGIFIYLNTIEGSGETVFYDGHHIKEAKPMLTVPAKQGSMVLFDFIDNPIHEGKPVVDNSKWFLGTYFHVRGWRDV
jgi:hypothetical protein|tara:strand:+ start:74 stop:790 length:717 start_codon:yes stop_codon:yes gene_type:complete